MRTLQVMVMDNIIVVNDIGRAVAGLEGIEPNLLAVDWDGQQGVLMYRDHQELIEDPADLDQWFQLYDDNAPPPVILPDGAEPSREASEFRL